MSDADDTLTYKIIQPLDPVVIYLQNDDIDLSLQKAVSEREAWFSALIRSHTQGAFGRRIGAAGFDVSIQCLKQRQKCELRSVYL